MSELKPCPFCGGEIVNTSGCANNRTKIMTLNNKCLKCGTTFSFKAKFTNNPYGEAIEAWNRREGEQP